MNKINLIACGGCGASISPLVAEQTRKVTNGDTGPSLSMYHIDTSKANKALSEESGAVFHHITTGVSEKELQGSGGLRSSNVTDTNLSIEKFLNDNPSATDTSSLTVLVSSASGGSGSIISPLLMSHLIRKKVPFCVMLIGDSTTLSYAINTSDTIKTFHAIAINLDVSVPIYYLDNKDVDKPSMVDAYMSGFFSSLAMFYMHDNKDIDFADMAAFLSPSNMRPKMDISAGIYYLDVLGGENTRVMTELDKESRIITARVLKGVDFLAPLVAMNQKEGEITDPNVFSMFMDKKFLPLCVFSQTNKTEDILSELEDVISKLSVKSKVDKVDYIADDSGLVL